MRSRIFAILVACAIPFALPALAGVNAWTTQGPPGGEPVRDLAASPTDPNVFYVAYGRNFARSVDGAATWQTVGGIKGQVLAIAVDPADGRRVYVLVYEQGLFRSDNAGDSFMQIAPVTQMISSMGVGGSDGRTVYYATSFGGFYRSLDRGATFEPRTTTLQSISRIYVESADGTDIIALRGSNVARSTDGGSTWSETAVDASTTFPIFPNALVRLSPTTLAMATSGGTYISNDDGVTWVRKAIGSSPSIVRDPQSPSTLYSSFYWDNRLWRSTDSGQYWSPFGAPMLGDARGLVARESGTGTRIVAASLGGVLHSENGGTSWTESVSGPIASSPSQMVTTSAANSRVIAYTGGGGLFANSRDSAWQRLNFAGAQAASGAYAMGQAILAMKPGDPQTIYLAPFQGSSIRSTDGGISWTLASAALKDLSVTALAFDTADSRVMYAAMSNFNSPPASLYRSTDSGSTWNAYSVDLPTVDSQSMVVDPADHNRIFLASHNAANAGGLYRSTNGGLNWTERGFLGADVWRLAIDPTDSNRVYAATRHGLQVSTNGGDTFVRNDPFAIVSPLAAAAVAVDPTVPSILYVASQNPAVGVTEFGGSTIARSVDHGLTWEVLRAATEPLPWYIGDIVLDPNLPSLVYVTTGGRGVATYEIQNDLSVVVSGHSGTKPIGAPSTLTARVEHHSALAATAARLDITMPPGLTAVTATPTAGTCAIIGVNPRCEFPVLRPGASIDVVVSYIPPTALPLPVTARIEAHERDNVAANDSSIASAIAGEVVDLRLSVTPSAMTVDHGDAVNYAVLVRNEGPVTASVAAVAFVAGAGLTLGATPAGCTAADSQITCIFNGLASGAERSVTINATASGVGPLTSNVAVAAAPSAVDTNAANNGAAPVITSRPVADLAITAADSADPVQAGTAFNYVVDVRSNGPDEMPAVAATLTAAGTVASATSTRGACTIAGAGVTCAIGTLASGATATITIATSVASAGTNTMHATVTGGGQDRVATNNSIDQPTTITARAGSSSSGAGGGGGGGGAFDWLWLALLGALLGWRGHRAIWARCESSP